jgi:hypothetical protein
MRRFASIAALPVMLTAALATAIFAMQRGVPPSALLLPIFGVSAALVAVLERVLPYRQAWNRPRAVGRGGGAALLLGSPLDA